MGFGKAFGLGLIIYIILNFVLNLVLYIVAGGDIGTYFNSISSAPLTFIASLFAINGIGFLAGSESIVTGLLAGISLIGINEVLTGIMYILAAILPGLITAIIVGKLSESAGKGFGALLLVYLITAVLFIVFTIIDPMQVMTYIAGIFMMFGSDTVMLIIGLLVYGGLFNGMFWGSISAVLAKES